MMRFSTEHLRKVFEDADKYENFKKLTYNLNHGIDIYEYDDDGNQRKVSKHEANKAIRKIIMEVCDLTEEDLRSNKRRERALELHHTEVYELLESDIDFKVDTAFKESEWFNDFVDMRNVKLGDEEEFWSREKVMLAVAEISGSYEDGDIQDS